MFGLMQLAAELDNPFLDNGFGFDKASPSVPISARPWAPWARAGEYISIRISTMGFLLGR